MQRISSFSLTFFCKVNISIAIVAAIALGSFSPTVASVTEQKMAKPSSLYKRLGGRPAIKKVVNDFVNIVTGDSRINRFFADTARDPKRLAKFKANLVDQICQASGGPCKYKGKDMKTAHKGMGISETDFNALVEDLVKALDANHVDATSKNELLGAFGEVKGEVVEGVDAACVPSKCPMHGGCKRGCKKVPCICSKN